MGRILLCLLALAIVTPAYASTKVDESADDYVMSSPSKQTRRAPRRRGLLGWALDTSRDLGEKLVARARNRIRRTWLRATLRGQDLKDAHGRLDLAYKVSDPWGMATPREQHRFAECNRIIREQLIAPSTRVGAILEIGCGEGHQTEHLSKLCDRMTGIDVSANAVERAKRRLPNARFGVGDLYAQPWIGEDKQFDVVTVFEVLCHVKDIPRLLDEVNRLGKACVASYFHKDAEAVEPHLATQPLLGRQQIKHGDYEWTVVWWKPS